MSWLQAPKANQAPGKRPRRDPEKSAASKLDYETKRKRNFLPSWTEKFPWLRYTEEAGEEYMMYCSTCRSLPDIADMCPAFSDYHHAGYQEAGGNHPEASQ
ncbi:Zinc finger and BTB domain containing protein 10 [Dissostichus eleginoides]|uniref:Zinc finger and BTB domain containing protein 10 n=1 Tax=Dissostichus eleginoides TaxID=100907 RepID=A0AAD9BN74_DISEL|nr:Zinc finger and BTB domain containing protein 10 [Dissostichus eleginoides]